MIFLKKFNASKILSQLSGYNDVLNRNIQANRIICNKKLLNSLTIRGTAKKIQPVCSSVMANTSEEISEEDGKVIIEKQKR